MLYFYCFMQNSFPEAGELPANQAVRFRFLRSTQLSTWNINSPPNAPIMQTWPAGMFFTACRGIPAFPVRLASEIYQRCLALRGQGTTPCTIYRSMLRGGLPSQRHRLPALGFDLPGHLLGH